MQWATKPTIFHRECLPTPSIDLEAAMLLLGAEEASGSVGEGGGH